jgi:hypothetical protein
MNGMHRVLWAFLVTAGLASGLAACANLGGKPPVAVGLDGKVQNPMQLLGQLPLLELEFLLLLVLLALLRTQQTLCRSFRGQLFHQLKCREV